MSTVTNPNAGFSGNIFIFLEDVLIKDQKVNNSSLQMHLTDEQLLNAVYQQQLNQQTTDTGQQIKDSQGTTKEHKSVTKDGWEFIGGLAACFVLAPFTLGASLVIGIPTLLGVYASIRAKQVGADHPDKQSGDDNSWGIVANTTENIPPDQNKMTEDATAIGNDQNNVRQTQNQMTTEFQQYISPDQDQNTADANEIGNMLNKDGSLIVSTLVGG